MNPYQALANAIVELAVKDYKKALKRHYRFPNSEDYAAEVKMPGAIFPFRLVWNADRP